MYRDPNKKWQPASFLVASPTGEGLWPALRIFCNKCFTHVCGHAMLFDKKTVLRENEFLFDLASKYLSFVDSRCQSCRCTAHPSSNKKFQWPRSIFSSMQGFSFIKCSWAVYASFILWMYIHDSLLDTFAAPQPLGCYGRLCSHTAWPVLVF